jgi:hypothetical protein
MRRVLDTRLETRMPLTVLDVERMVRTLQAMETAAIELEGRPTVMVSEKTLDLARRLEAAGIVP